MNQSTESDRMEPRERSQRALDRKRWRMFVAGTLWRMRKDCKDEQLLRWAHHVLTVKDGYGKNGMPRIRYD